MSDKVSYALGRFQDATSGLFGAVVRGDEVVPLDRLGERPTVEAMLADWDSNLESLDAAVEESVSNSRWSTLTVDQATLRPLAPFTPGQIFQSGANYKKHVVQLMVAAAAHGGEDDLDEVRVHAVELMEERAARGTPYVFIGLPSAICGPIDDVVLPPTGNQHDWELELGVVIGLRARNVSRADALSHVAGYTIANDITTRDRVFRPDMPGLGTDWLAGKNAPTFLPLGPWLVPARSVADPMDVRITLELNGDTMQDESTADMIFDIAQLIEHVSAITPLNPGDLLLTGSPAGNGAHFGRYLQPGDTMDATITGLGTQRNVCVGG